MQNNQVFPRTPTLSPEQSQAAEQGTCPGCGEPGALLPLYRVVGLRFFGCKLCHCAAVLSAAGEPEFCLERAA